MSSVTEAVTWPDASSWCGSWPVRACRGVRCAGASRDRRARSSRDQRPVGLVGRALPRRAASPVGRGWWALPVRTFSRVGARRPPCLPVPVLVVGRRGGGPRAPAGVHRSGSGRPWGGRPAAGARRCRPAGSGSVACDRGVRCRPGRCGAALAGCEARSGWVPGGRSPFGFVPAGWAQAPLCEAVRGQGSSCCGSVAGRRVLTTPVVVSAEWVPLGGRRPAPLRHRGARSCRARGRLGPWHRPGPPGTTTTGHHRSQVNPQNRDPTIASVGVGAAWSGAWVS